MTEVQKYTNGPVALTAPTERVQAMQEAFAVNLSTGSISEFDLPRIKVVPGGATLWQIPGLEGDETAGRIEGVIVYIRESRAYYTTKEVGNRPPDCYSRDGKRGVGDPGGDCLKCPLAQFDSAEEGTGGQACKQHKHLFMLRGEAMFPEIVSLPPTSLRAARQFMLRALTQGIPYFHALVSIDLEKATNSDGKPYAKANFKVVRRLTPDEMPRATEYNQMCQSLFANVTLTDATFTDVPPPASQDPKAAREEKV